MAATMHLKCIDSSRAGPNPAIPTTRAESGLIVSNGPSGALQIGKHDYYQTRFQ